ncbi:serine/threonine-protein kinase [Tessaracoccus oleiagri]|uniref:non-specific serine/threonine protein kinase n=1 Tax=Tessaracoccus oleiagri TaxID=686624 RepID=A0A1G9H1X3_9ACTN|nr:serine/threonine-protein kinase [Tessaracoccus oleiagri]SDL06842.1 serine/threonine protein kinase [Tessaracoccus oleiagri]
MDEPVQPTAGVRTLANRYRLIEQIGRGGMATVYRAVDELLQREVAVKILDLTTPTGDPAAEERFRLEARTTAALQHDNIVTVFDTGFDDEHAYLVMELLPGQTLAQEVKTGGPLPVDDVRDIGAQVAAALAAAHQHGIIHRDIKPGNIARAEDGRIKVLDFGITRLVDEAQDTMNPLTTPETVIGTAHYLSPEQAAGRPADERSDLYALGCVLFTLLAGRAPYHGDSPVVTVMQHATAPVPDVRDARPDVPPGLAAIIAALMAKDPAERPASAAVVASMLSGDGDPDAATALLPLTASAAPRRAQQTDSRSGVLWVLLALVLLAGGVGAYAAFMDDGSTPVAADDSVAPTVDSTVESASPSPTTSPAEPIAQTPSPRAEPTTSAPATTQAPPPDTRPPATSRPPATTSAPPAEPTTTQAPPPEETTQQPPTAVTPDAGPVHSASAALSNAVRQAFQADTISNDDRKQVDAALRDLAAALRAQDGEQATAALSAVGQAIADTGRGGDFGALYGDLQDAVDQWRTALY